MGLWAHLRGTVPSVLAEMGRLMQCGRPSLAAIQDHLSGKGNWNSSRHPSYPLLPLILLFDFSFIFCVLFWLHVWICTICMPNAYLGRPEGGAEFPGNGIMDSCKLPFRVWELNCRSQQMLLTAEQSLQPLYLQIFSSSMLGPNLQHISYLGIHVTSIFAHTLNNSHIFFRSLALYII